MTIQKTFVLGLAALGLSSAAHAQTITDPAAFASAIAGVRAVDNSADKFAEPPPFPIEGKAFRLTLPATSSIEGSGGVNYDYKDGALVLDASPRDVWPSHVGPSEALPSFTVTDSTKSLGNYVGQNAYGAKANVSVFKNVTAAIAILTSPKPMLSPMRTRIGGGMLDDTDWWIKLELPPAEAKAVANDVVGVIEGRYARLPNGKPGACMSGGVTPTIANPSSYSTETCYVAAHIDRIALVRKSSGEVLKEWTNENSPRLGPTLWGKIQAGMNKRELIAVYPELAADTVPRVLPEAIPEMKKNVVTSVVVYKWPVKGMALANLLTEKYGPPIEIDCKFDSVCGGQWKVSDGVSAYMTRMGVYYQPTGAEPPFGYYVGK